MASELRLPEPVRSRVLLEMASDLEAMYEHFRALGHEEERAAALAEEKLLASPESVRELVLVHTTAVQRVGSSVIVAMRDGFHAFLFAAGAMPILVFSGYLLATRLTDGLLAPLVLPVLVLGAVVVVAGGSAVWQLFRLPAGRAVVPPAGLPQVILCGAMAPVVGAFAFLVSLHRAAMGLATSGAEGPALVEVAEQVGRAAVVFGMGLQVGIAAALFWFVLESRLALRQEAESAALLATA